MAKSGRVVFLFLLWLSPSLSAQSEPTSIIPDVRKFELNEKVNPCDDFHQYVCSKVESGFKLREDRSSHTFAFSDSSERLLEKKKEFLKNIGSEKKLSARSLQFKNYYLACMNEAESIKEERQLVRELRQQAERIRNIKQFVELSRQNMTKEHWSLVGYGIIPNIDNPLVYDVTFGVSLMGLPEHSYYDNEQLVKDYAQLIVETFKEIYPEQEAKVFEERAAKMIEFEKRFRDIYPYPAEFRQRYTQPRQVSRTDFLKRTDTLKLEPFFKAHVPAKTLIRDFIPEGFEFLQREIKEENLQVLKDLYVYRNARGLMDDAYPELFQKRWDFSHKYLGGPVVRPDREERCTGAVMGAFGRELDHELLPRLFPQFPEEKVKDVAEKIRSSILEGITKNDWLSEAGKKGALEKIQKAQLQLVKPRNAKEWDFKDVQRMDPKRPNENVKRLVAAGHKRAFKKLREGVNQQAWGMAPLTVNAYYSPDKNKFVMPIGILQYPFFIKDGDVIENLGAVGTVIGHELGHSIDDEGSKFDAEGKLNQWMTEEDLKTFQKRGQVMIEQFNRIGHNGLLTQGENIADLVGLTFSYNAAFPENKGQIEDKKRFFVSYARVWCGVMREKAKEMQLKTDPHSMGYARINEQVKHQDGFHEAYQCKKKNKLYLEPSKRVKIW